MCGQVGVHVQVHMWSVISLCKCYASTKEKQGILTSFVSWKSNSIFSDQGIGRVLIFVYIFGGRSGGVWEFSVWIKEIWITDQGIDSK